MWAQFRRGWHILILFSLCSLTNSQWHKDGLEEVRCPTYIGNAPCDCVAASDGLDFTCNAITRLADIRAVVSAARFAIKTLVVAQLDPNTTVVPERTFANGSVNDFTIQSSNLEEIVDDAFEGTHQRLHTLSIHNSLQLKIVPRAVHKIASLKRLDLSQNAISEIYPYTFFGSAKLSYLNLEANQLSSMAENAFLGLENTLRELNLKDNQFHTFPMSAVKILKKLQSLNLADNQVANITTEPFTRLETIRLLDLNGNHFTFLDKETLDCMPNLQRLWLANNGLEDIEAGSLSGLHDLETIDLSGNSLKDLPRDIFAHTRRLTSVDLSRNKIKSLTGVFFDLFALEEVFLNDNLLLVFTNEWFANTPNVKTIHLEHNVLLEIEENAMQPLKRLAQLYLSHNFLSAIGATYFRYNVALTNLHLDNNHIGSIHPTAFRGVPKLRALRLDNNNLRAIDRSLFASLTSLTELHLQDNKLTEIEPQAFSSLANLAHLDVTNNRMTNLEDIMMRYPSALKALYLDNNRLQGFHHETFSGQTYIDVLSMSDNKLERIPKGVFKELINLFRLSLANNRIAVIEDFAFEGLPRVRFLDLQNNRLSRLTNETLKGLQQAEVVDISHNRIALIQPEAFSGFHHIKELDLSYNKLRTIKSGAFRGCLTLTTLRLRSTGIQYMEAHALDDFVALVDLDLRDNQLVMPNTFARLIKALPGLKTLKLSGNDLTNVTSILNKHPEASLSLASMQQLKHLELENCQLSNISASLWSSNTNLKVVKLGGNDLSSLPEALFAKQIFLEELHLDRNQFERVPNEALKYLYHLKVLNMSGNLITHLRENNFDYVGSLLVLDLSANNMRMISERAFQNVTKLQELNLETNLVSTFYSRTFMPLSNNLLTFRGRGNQIPFIPVALFGLRKVVNLDLSLNMMSRLKEIPQTRAVMASVREVKISYSNLTTVSPTDFELVPNLIKLDLSCNKLSRVAPYAFRGLDKLQWLDMSRNEVMHLSRERFIGLLQLQQLNLSRNSLAGLGTFPSDLRGLVILDLSYNRLRSLARDSLTHLTRLVRLDLRGNLLSQLGPEVLHPMPSIKALDLADNSFSVLPLDGIQAIEDTLESVNFEGNPLICSCQSYVQKIWLRQHRKWLSTQKRGSKVGPQCTEPTPILDRYLLTVKDSELCPLPSVNSLQLSHIKPHSFLLTWDSPDTNMTGLKGFIVAYHRLDMNDQVKKFRLPSSIRGFKIEQVMDNTLYLVCVVTRGSSWRSFATSSTSDPDEASADETDLRLRALTAFDDSEASGLYDYEAADEEYDIEALESLGFLSRTEREAEAGLDFFGLGSEADGLGGSSNSLFMFPEWITGSLNANLTGGEETTSINYPSSNDTDLLILRPMVVNLGSRSSKCTEIKTPIDPATLRFVDNKRMSIIIGCVAGILIFIFIIISIVMNRDVEKDDEPEDEDSMTGSHKSPRPSAKTNRSDSLTCTPNQRNMSRNNSQSSSLLNRISLAEAAGPDALPPRVNRNSTGGPGSASGTLKRGSNTIVNSNSLSRSQQSRDINAQAGTGGLSGAPQPNPNKQQSYSSSGGRLMSKQSSTESGPSSSNRLSRQSSSETTERGPAGGGGGPRRSLGGGNDPYQSWHGTPRVEHRRSNGAEFNSHTTSLPRRNPHGGVEGGGKRRSQGNADPSAIPLIEYSLVEQNGHHVEDTARLYATVDHNRGRGSGGGGGARPKVNVSDNRRSFHDNANHIGESSRLGNHVDSEAAEAEDYYPDEPSHSRQQRGPPGGGRPGHAPGGVYVKYNSFANY